MIACSSDIQSSLELVLRLYSNRFPMQSAPSKRTQDLLPTPCKWDNDGVTHTWPWNSCVAICPITFRRFRHHSPDYNLNACWKSAVLGKPCLLHFKSTAVVCGKQNDENCVNVPIFMHLTYCIPQCNVKVFVFEAPTLFFFSPPASWPVVSD